MSNDPLKEFVYDVMGNAHDAFGTKAMREICEEEMLDWFEVGIDPRMTSREDILTHIYTYLDEEVLND